jgi:hypothetical protein
VTSVLVRVVAPHFVAGLVLIDGICTRAAPKLRPSLGKSLPDLFLYFASRGWDAEVVP